MDSCWYGRGGCARCTLDSSSRPSQQGKGTDPGGLNLTGYRYTAMLEKKGGVDDYGESRSLCKHRRNSLGGRVPL